MMTTSTAAAAAGGIEVTDGKEMMTAASGIVSHAGGQMTTRKVTSVGITAIEIIPTTGRQTSAGRMTVPATGTGTAA